MKTYLVIVLLSFVVFQSNAFPFFYHPPEISGKVSSTVVDERENNAFEFVNIVGYNKSISLKVKPTIIEVYGLLPFEEYKNQINPGDLSYMKTIANGNNPRRLKLMGISNH